MNEFLMIVIAIVVIAGGSLLVYFLLKKYYSDKEADNKGKKPVKNAKAAEIAAKKAEEAAKKASEEAEKEKARQAIEKRKAEMMKKTVIEADKKVLDHDIIRKVSQEVSSDIGAVALVTVMANRINITYKEASAKEPMNIFFDSPSLSRLEQGEMKLVAEHIYNLVKVKGFEIEEIGSGEKGTYRYHIDKYEIKAL